MTTTGVGRLDVTRAGSREWTAAEEDQVVRYAQQYLVGGHVTMATISRATGIDGRTVRAILSHHDGRTFVVCGGDEGLMLARYAEDAAALTARLRATAAALLERAERRAAYPLPVRQPGLF